MEFLKKYRVEILVFAAILGLLLICAAPDMTWINTDSDGVHYVYAAKYLYPSHKGSAPLYLLLGHLFLYLPFGTEFWRMALISVLSGLAASVFIYLIIMEKVGNRSHALIGASLYGVSILALSQNTIVEAYPLVTAVCLAVFYFCLKKKWTTAAVLVGVAGAIHPTSMLVIIPMLIFFKELRQWKRLGVMALFVLFYLYIPLTNRPPYMWQASNQSGGLFGFIKDSWDTAIMLTGGLSIWDLPKRLLDASGLILLSFGAALIPLYFALRKQFYKRVLFWLVAIPTVYYITDLAPQTYVYLQPAIAFGAVAVGIGLTKLKHEKLLGYGTAVRAIVFFVLIIGAVDFHYMDIGVMLDPELSAVKYYTEELPKVPDGQVLMPQYAWEWAAIYPYNRNENRNITPVCIDTLLSPVCQQQLRDDGILFEDNFAKNILERQCFIATSIVTLNDNIWTTQSSVPETYGAKIVPATVDMVTEMLEIKSSDRTLEPQWHFKPSNPMGIITGSIEVNEWHWITWSPNRSCIMFVAWGMFGYFPYWLIERILSKRRKAAKNAIIQPKKAVK